jgi:hypothetical protein
LLFSSLFFGLPRLIAGYAFNHPLPFRGDSLHPQHKDRRTKVRSLADYTTSTPVFQLFFRDGANFLQDFMLDAW